MSARARTYAVVGAVALAAAGTIVGGVLATRSHVAPPVQPRAGKPPYAADPTAPAALAHEVRVTLRAAPADAAAHLQRLVAQYPRSALVRLELGLALFWLRRDADALLQWRDAKRVQPDSPSAVRADDLLHPAMPRGLPPFVPTFEPPGHGRVQALLLRGAALQEAQRPVSAERAFAAAARAAPGDAEAQVAAAVGRFDKDHPERAFARLGPLTARFPRAQTVRFHLGLLLIYLRDFSQARREFLLVRAGGPRTRLGRTAETFLKRLEQARSSGSQR